MLPLAAAGPEDVAEAKARLLGAAAEDRAIRARLAAGGALFDGYHPEMEAAHLRNAAVLESVIAIHGWPGRRRFGDDGAAAAFLILQHAISRPDLQRRGLDLLMAGVAQGEASPVDVAYLADRIAVFEGRPQLFGTQFDWEEAGLLSPAAVDDPDGVDARRADIGLPPLAEAVAQMRARAAADAEGPPADLAARRAGFEAWARRVGWR